MDIAHGKFNFNIKIKILFNILSNTVVVVARINQKEFRNDTACIRGHVCSMKAWRKLRVELEQFIVGRKYANSRTSYARFRIRDVHGTDVHVTDIYIREAIRFRSPDASIDQYLSVRRNLSFLTGSSIQTLCNSLPTIRIEILLWIQE